MYGQAQNVDLRKGGEKIKKRGRKGLYNCSKSENNQYVIPSFLFSAGDVKTDSHHVHTFSGLRPLVNLCSTARVYMRVAGETDNFR
jgi:hypothetical protein